MTTRILLYLLPLLARVDGFGGSWAELLLSVLPTLAVLAPTLRFAQWFGTGEREHVLRHAVYAAAFGVSCASAIVWAHAPLTLELYAIIGSATLWYFAFVHYAENRGWLTWHTHHGDVTVLPLTLIAVHTFVDGLADACFRGSRSVAFLVPVHVAWATLNLIAFTSFATSRTTTLDHPAFDMLGTAALVVSSTHLSLIEMRAHPISYLFFPIVASFFMQRMRHPEAGIRLRDALHAGTAVVAGALGAGLGALLGGRAWVYAYVAVAYALGAQHVLGERWPAPAALYAALWTTAYGRADAALAAAHACGFYVVFQCTSAAIGRVVAEATPTDAPSREDTLVHARHPMTRCMRLVGCPCSSARVRYGDDDDALFARMLRRKKPGCPAAFRGVWWMRRNGLPIQLITAEDMTWRRRSDGAYASYVSNAFRTIARTASVASVGLYVLQCFVCTRTTWDGGRWVRNDMWTIPGLRLRRTTLWFYRVDDDTMVRVVYDQHGRVVWQYDMLRVFDGARRTRHYAAFSQEHGGDGVLLL